jgi:hypothetical protein
VNGMVLVRILIGAVWLNGGVEKVLNPEFPRQFAASLEAGGFVSQAPPFFQDFMKGYVVPNAELFAQLMRAGELTLGLRFAHQPRRDWQRTLERGHPIVSGGRAAWDGSRLTRVSHDKRDRGPDLYSDPAQPEREERLRRLPPRGAQTLALAASDQPSPELTDLATMA